MDKQEEGGCTFRIRISSSVLITILVVFLLDVGGTQELLYSKSRGRCLLISSISSHGARGKT